MGEQKILLELGKREQNQVTLFFHGMPLLISFMPLKTTFSSYFKKYKDLYTTHCTNWDGFKKVHWLCGGGMYLVILVDMRPYFTGIALNIISTTNTTQNFTIA